MKRTLLLFVIAGITGLAVSCGSSPDQVSASRIVRQFNNYLKESAQDKSFVQVPVGKYELNDDDDRLQLRMLQAAGLITYKASRYPWWEKSVRYTRKPYQVTRYFYGYTYTDEEYRWVSEDVYTFEDHYIVQVALTQKGESLVVDSMPEPIEKKDKDLINKEVDPNKYAWNKVDLTEKWDVIENPFLPKETAKKAENTVEETHSSTTEKSQTANGQKDETERIDKKMYEAYKALSLDSHYVIMKGSGLKAVKARNIQINTKNGHPQATAEVILSTNGTSDAARILRRAEDGQKMLVPVTLTYYLDKGWVLDEKGDMPDDYDD